MKASLACGVRWISEGQLANFFRDKVWEHAALNNGPNLDLLEKELTKKLNKLDEWKELENSYKPEELKTPEELNGLAPIEKRSWFQNISNVYSGAKKWAGKVRYGQRWLDDQNFLEHVKSLMKELASESQTVKTALSAREHPLHLLANLKGDTSIMYSLAWVPSGQGPTNWLDLGVVLKPTKGTKPSPEEKPDPQKRLSLGLSRTSSLKEQTQGSRATPKRTLSSVEGARPSLFTRVALFTRRPPLSDTAEDASETTEDASDTAEDASKTIQDPSSSPKDSTVQLRRRESLIALGSEVLAKVKRNSSLRASFRVFDVVPERSVVDSNFLPLDPKRASKKNEIYKVKPLESGSCSQTSGSCSQTPVVPSTDVSDKPCVSE